MQTIRRLRISRFIKNNPQPLLIPVKANVEPFSFLLLTVLTVSNNSSADLNDVILCSVTCLWYNPTFGQKVSNYLLAWVYHYCY